MTDAQEFLILLAGIALALVAVGFIAGRAFELSRKQRLGWGKQTFIRREP